jgi:S-phase kinase-associated protein 1
MACLTPKTINITIGTDKFIVTETFTNQSKTIKEQLEDTTDSDIVYDPSNLNPRVFAQLVELTLILISLPRVTEEEKVNQRENPPNISAVLTKYNNENLVELIIAANYLDISLVSTAIAKHLALVIRDKSPKQIRELFFIGDEEAFTESEEAALRKEYEWAVEPAAV